MMITYCKSLDWSTRKINGSDATRNQTIRQYTEPLPLLNIPNYVHLPVNTFFLSPLKRLFYAHVMGSLRIGQKRGKAKEKIFALRRIALLNNSVCAGSRKLLISKNSKSVHISRTIIKEYCNPDGYIWATQKLAVIEELVTWLADQAAKGRKASGAVLRKYGNCLETEANEKFSSHKLIRFFFEWKVFTPRIASECGALLCDFWIWKWGPLDDTSGIVAT